MNPYYNKLGIYIFITKKDQWPITFGMEKGGMENKGREKTLRRKSGEDSDTDDGREARVEA
jgi:hypothetical protein